MFNKIPIGGRLLTENVEALILEDGFTLLWDSEKQVVSFDNLKASWDFTESLEWKTDVIKAYEAEQRIAVRVYPRVNYNYQFLLTEQEYREIRAILRSWNGASEWLNLLWIDAVTIASVNSSDTVLTFNTTTANYQVGQYVAVVEQDDTVNLYEIDLVTNTSITIDGSLGFTANNVRVMPVDIVTIPKGFSIKRGANNKNFATVTLESVLNNDLSTAGNFTKYKSLDVLLESQPILGGMDELLMQSVDVFDNGQGLIEYVDSSAYLLRTLKCNFFKIGNAERYALKRFFHRMKGRRGAFWLPSFHNDIVISANITSSQTFINVSAFGYSYFDNNSPSHFVIEMNNGTRYFNCILSSVRGQETETFNLESSFGVAINIANIKRVMFIYKVRFDSDIVEFNFPSYQIATVSMPVVEVLA